jgi:predicted SnoaL-like aldol condensation-catalyzing enzyme
MSAFNTENFVMHCLKYLRWSLTAVLIAAMPIVSAQAATFTAQEKANMKVVEDFYVANDAMAAAGDVNMIHGIAEKFIGEGYIQHMAAGKKYGNGRDNFVRMTLDMPSRPARAAGGPPAGGPAAGSPPAGAPAAGGPPRQMQPAQVLALWAKDDLVIRVSGRGPTEPGATGPANVIFNMFRVVNGKLVEHWDSSSSESPGRGGGPAGAAPTGAAPPGAGPSGPAP